MLFIKGEGHLIVRNNKEKMIITTLNEWEREGDDGSLGVGMNECRIILITYEFICEHGVGRF